MAGVGGVGVVSEELKLAELKALWEFYDKDNSNTLTKDEITLFLERLRMRDGLADSLPEGFSDCVFEFLDKDHNGFVDWEEFVSHFNEFWVNRRQWFSLRKSPFASEKHIGSPQRQSLVNRPLPPSRTGSETSASSRSSRSASMMVPHMRTAPGQIRLKEKREAPISDAFRCPHCAATIEDKSLEQDSQESQGKHDFSSCADGKSDWLPTSVTASRNACTEISERGKVVGPVPSSFLASPYNIHTWASPW
eukprot:GHVS01092583.1.p1 GENE.GHVS01092583.1~~GHVS01092583.1.p1  ORF type:complete len:250 (-),score=15.41 GHVS01092583.1:10-759(-)